MFSDSLSVLKSIANCKCDNLFLVDLLHLHSRLICDNKEIAFQDMLVSEKTVLLTWQLNMLWKSFFNKTLAFPHSHFKVLTNVYAKKLCQTELERYPENNLHKILPKVDDPLRLMVNVAVKNVYYADCILVTHFNLFYLITIYSL